MGDPARNLVVIDVDDLERRIEGAVRRALAARSNEPAPEYLTTKQAAELVGVHPRSVIRLVRDEGLPAIKLGDKTMRYDRAAVLEWMRGRGK